MPEPAKSASLFTLPRGFSRPANSGRSDAPKTGIPDHSRPTLLWIDDFEPALELYKRMFEDRGFRVLTASSGDRGVRLARENHVDVVVTDFEMPGMNGLAVANSIKARNSRTPVVLFTGSTLVPLRARHIVDAFCDKAASRDQLLAAIHGLLPHKNTASLQPPPVPRASHHGHRTVA